MTRRCCAVPRAVHRPAWSCHGSVVRGAGRPRPEERRRGTTVDASRPRAEAVAVRGNGSSPWARTPTCRRSWEAGRASSTSLAAPSSRASTTRTPPSGDRHCPSGRGPGRHTELRGGGRARAAAVKKRKPGEWIRGRGWHEGKWDAPAPGSVRGFPTTRLSPRCRRTTRSSSAGDGPRRPREREGNGGEGITRDGMLPRAARSSGTRRARRLVSSWTTRSDWSPPRSARRTRSAAPSSWRWTSASPKGSPA